MYASTFIMERSTGMSLWRTTHSPPAAHVTVVVHDGGEDALAVTGIEDLLTAKMAAVGSPVSALAE
jgi:hypothetical protein